MLDEALAFEPGWQLAAKLKAKEVSSVELTELFLARIERIDPQINSYLTVTAELALSQARDADAAIAKDGPRGPLHGLPLSLKDLVITKGVRTTRGSVAFRDWVPDADDIVAERVRASGAVWLGKTNTPEMGHRGSTENLLGEPCRNPWDVTRTAGGSSGGAAAALAAGLCPVATGSDGGGSIRIPAGFCGVYGIKPTQGRVPGPYTGPGGWRPFSQNGPMARTVLDAATLLQQMAGPDPRDPMAIPTTPPDFAAACVPDVRGLRMGWSPDLGDAAVDPEVRAIAEQAAKRFQAMGATVVELQLDFDSELVLDTFNTVWLSDLSANFSALLDSHADKLDPVLREQIERANAWSAPKLAKALRQLELHRVKVAKIFEDVDLLLTPSLAVEAFPIGEFPKTIDERMVPDPLWSFTAFSYPFNMSGNPAASIPCGFTANGLPIGLHAVGRRGAEETVIRASAAFEQAHPWDNVRPTVS
jgi:aspartyl-tRNA(Asn)/glutamyl-tRNA(Gln) amidotransferase subunit A